MLCYWTTLGMGAVLLDNVKREFCVWTTFSMSAVLLDNVKREFCVLDNVQYECCVTGKR